MVKCYLRYAAVASLAISISLFAVGCSQKTVVTSGDTDSSQVEGSLDRQGDGAANGHEEPLDSSPEQAKSLLTILEGRSTGPMLPIYYDFDKSSVRVDQKNRIKKNADYIKDSSDLRVMVEGNCDERGTNEYNMALGERRAISAKKYLMNLGVAGNRISTISYGEEKPLNHGHDELAWSQNRRADFVQK